MGCKRIALSVIAVSLLSALAGCEGGEQAQPKAEGGEDVLAVVGDEVVTTADIDLRREQMAPEVRAEFDNPSMLSSLIDREIKVRVWAKAAEDEGLTKTDKFEDMLEAARVSILAEMYKKGIRAEASELTEEDLRRAYERDKHLYSRDAEVSARHILCPTAERAEEALAAIEGGMSFEDAVAEFSNDVFTKDQGGDLGKLTRNTAFPGLGVSPDFFDEIASTEAGEIAGPIATRRGYHIVQVLDKSAGMTRSFSEVRGQLERRIVEERSRSGETEDLVTLWDRYNVEMNHEAIKKYIGYPLTPDDYMRHIREATTSGDKITLCDAMLREFPESRYAPYALMTMGFVYSEELHNYVDATKAFRTLINQYPSSKLVQAAEWMLRNMQGDHPPLRNVEHVVEIARGAGD